MNTQIGLEKHKDSTKNITFLILIKLFYLLIRLWLTTDRARVNLEIGKLYREINMTFAAEEFFTAASAGFRLSSEHVRIAMLNKALIRKQAKDYLTALGLLKLLTHKDYVTHEILELMSYCLFELELFDQAEIAARNAYLINFRSTTAQALLVKALNAQRKFTYAEITLNTMLRDNKNPELLPLYQNWFEILYSMKKFGRALDVAEKMVELAENTPEISYETGQALTFIADRYGSSWDLAVKAAGAKYNGEVRAIIALYQNLVYHANRALKPKVMHGLHMTPEAFTQYR